MPLNEEDLIQAIKASALEQDHIRGLLGAPNQPIETHFVQLALVPPQITQRFERRGADVHEQDDVQSLNLSDLFLPLEEGAAFSRQLLWGRAGSGKSILCQYMAWCFAQGQYPAWNNPIQVILPLRLKRLGLARYEPFYNLNDITRTTARILYHELLSETQKRRLAERVGQGDLAFEQGVQLLYDWLIQNNPRVLLLLDGLDEVVMHLEAATLQGSVLRTLCEHSSLLLTSRPLENTNALERLGRFQRVLENRGFNAYDIRGYTRTFFNTDDLLRARGEALLAYFTHHRDVFDLARTPLLLHLLCRLWQRAPHEEALNNALGGGYAALYQYVTLAFVRHHREKALRHDGQLEALKKFQNQADAVLLQDLQAQYAAPLSFLYELAYRGFIQPSKTLAIEPDILMHVLNGYPNLDFITEIRSLGLLVSIGDGEDALRLPYEYLHLTFQEFFTAMHLAHVLADQADVDAAIWDNLIHHRYHRRWEWVWRFLAGLIHTEDGLGHLIKEGQERAQSRFWSIIWGKPYEEIGFGHLRLLAIVLEETQGRHRFATHWEKAWVDALLDPKRSLMQPSLYLKHLSTELTLYPRLHEQLTWAYLKFSPKKLPKTLKQKETVLSRCETFQPSEYVLQHCFTPDDWYAFLIHPDPEIRYYALHVLGRIQGPPPDLVGHVLKVFDIETEPRNQLKLLQLILNWLKPELKQGMLEHLATCLEGLEKEDENSPNIILPHPQQAQCRQQLQNAFDKAWSTQPITSSFLEAFQQRWLAHLKYQTQLKRLGQPSEDKQLQTYLPAIFFALESEEPLLRQAGWYVLYPFFSLLSVQLRQQFNTLLLNENHSNVKSLGKAIFEGNRDIHPPSLLQEIESSSQSPILECLIQLLLLGWENENLNIQWASVEYFQMLVNNVQEKNLEVIIQTLLDALRDKNWKTRQTALEVLKTVTISFQRERLDVLTGVLVDVYFKIKRSAYYIKDIIFATLMTLLPYIKNQEVIFNAFNENNSFFSLDHPFYLSLDYPSSYDEFISLALAFLPYLQEKNIQLLVKEFLVFCRKKTLGSVNPLPLITTYFMTDEKKKDFLKKLVLFDLNMEKEGKNFRKALYALIKNIKIEYIKMVEETLLESTKEFSTREIACGALGILATRLKEKELDSIIHSLLFAMKNWDARAIVGKTLSALALTLQGKTLEVIQNAILKAQREDIILATNKNENIFIRGIACQTLGLWFPHMPLNVIKENFEVLLNFIKEKHGIMQWAACKSIRVLAPHLEASSLKISYQVLFDIIKNEGNVVNYAAFKTMGALALELQGEYLKTLIDLFRNIIKDKNSFGGREAIVCKTLGVMALRLHEDLFNEVIGSLLTTAIFDVKSRVPCVKSGEHMVTFKIFGPLVKQMQPKYLQILHHKLISIALDNYDINNSFFTDADKLLTQLQEILSTLSSPKKQMTLSEQINATFTFNLHVNRTLFDNLTQQPIQEIMNTLNHLQLLADQGALQPWISISLNLLYRDHQKYNTLAESFNKIRGLILKSTEEPSPAPVVNLSNTLLQHRVSLFKTVIQMHSALSCVDPVDIVYNEHFSPLLRIKLLQQLAQSLTHPTTIPRDQLPRFSSACLGLFPRSKRKPTSMHRLVHVEFPEQNEDRGFSYTLSVFPAHRAVRIRLKLEKLNTINAQLIAFEQALLACPSSVRYLDLSDNQLTDASISFLLSHGSRFPELQGLALEANRITAQGYLALLQFIKQTPLRKLSLADNHIMLNIQTFKQRILPLVKTQLDFLDISLNEIYSGYVYVNQGGYPCVPRDEKEGQRWFAKQYNALEESAQAVSWNEQRHFCEDHLLHHPALWSRAPLIPIPSLFSKPPFGFPSSIARELTPERGLVALVRQSSGIKQHVFLLIESITEFGQRSLIRAELFVRGAQIQIFVTYMSTAELLKMAHEHLQENHEETFEQRIRMARLDNVQRQVLLNTIFQSQDRQHFERYSLIPLGNNHAINCLRWAVKRLEQAKIIDKQEMILWAPDTFYKKGSCLVM